MDAHRDSQPAPTTLIEVPEHVRKFLNSLDEEDIQRFRKWNSFIVWAETSGRYSRFVIKGALVMFGIFVTIKGGMESWSWLIKRGGP